MRQVFAAVAGVALFAAGPARAGEPAEAPAAPALRGVGWQSGEAPRAPLNFRVTPYARGLDGPQALLVLPNGDVLVAEARAPGGRPSADRITLLRDSDGDGVADQQVVLAEGLARPSGLALRRDRLYVGTAEAVERCRFLVGQTRLAGPCQPILALPAEDGHGHWGRSLAFSPDETRLYVAVGAHGEADAPAAEAAVPERAAILVAGPDGKDARVYAGGLRAATALAVEPGSERLWATVGERELPGGEAVADYLTGVRDGAYYGWPYAYLGSHEDPRRRGERPDLVARTLAPDYPLEPRAGAVGLVFYARTHFPNPYRSGAFIAEQGGAGRAGAAGARVVFVPFAAGRPAGPAQDFLTGFASDAAGGALHARPTALAVATDGTLLVADDAGSVWRVTFKCAACTPDPVPPRRVRPAATGERH